MDRSRLEAMQRRRIVPCEWIEAEAPPAPASFYDAAAAFLTNNAAAFVGMGGPPNPPSSPDRQPATANRPRTVARSKRPPELRAIVVTAPPGMTGPPVYVRVIGPDELEQQRRRRNEWPLSIGVLAVFAAAGAYAETNNPDGSIDEAKP